MTLHRVQPRQDGDDFQPNRLLEVTPDYLEAVVRHLREADIDLVSLDEASNRLNDPDARRFVCLTFDDGYRDNLELAYPILKKHNVPFCIYVATGLIDRQTEPWWLVLEEVLRKSQALDFAGEGVEWSAPLRTSGEKCAAYQMLWHALMTGDQHWQRRIIRRLADQADISIDEMNDELFMTWDEVRTINQDPLVTIGAHTVNHYALRRLGRDEAREEIIRGAAVLAEQLGENPAHFSYPYGMAMAASEREFQLAAEIGFKTAVTTRPGLLHRKPMDVPTALPRISLNGEYQDLRYLDVLLSGAPMLFYKGLKLIKGERLRASEAA
ncbi:polysaccharide deacetylase family protein [Coralliovum pocilloporae]|uniref:polysaccharide deacetylase family protein n=1 Tax=Coralliovum pocilloporae TaxID=3066369 RepID=UPI003307B340